MSVLSNLEPKAVFTFFEELCAIPHGSGHTRAISDYLAAFGRARGLETHQDAANNVIIKAPGTPGYEHSAPVIVQGHMDMVCAKAPDCAKDMEREGLDRLKASTQIMITPLDYEFRIVHNIVTNFHQPKSTLLLLVSAFVGDGWRRIYDYALGHGFRFLSYGDSSVLLRE